MCINENEHMRKYNNSVIQNLFQYIIYVGLLQYSNIFCVRVWHTSLFFLLLFRMRFFFFANPAKIGWRDAQNPTGMRLLAVDQICIKK